MYVSKAYEGRIHDYKLLNKESPSDKDWFKNLVVIADLGYLGIEKDYKCKKIIMKDKKQKQKELTRSQKLNNKKKSKMRIKVEHSICGVKKYKIMSEKLKITDINLYNRIIGVCYGLFNFYIMN